MRLVWLLVVFCCFVSVSAQLRFRTLNAENGLSQSSVNFVIRDKNGYYWIGTQYGLNRYDGKNIRSYYTYTQEGLADNFLINAVEDVHGNIWFGTRNNLTRYEPDKDRFTKIISDTLITKVNRGHNAVYYLLIDEEGNIVFNSGGHLLKIDKMQQTRTIPRLDFVFGREKHYQQIFFHSGFLFGVVKDSLIKFRIAGGKTEVKEVIKLHVEKPEKRHVLFTTKKAGFMLYDRKLFCLSTDTLKEVLDPIVSRTEINCLTYTDDRYWMGTDEGLYEISEDFQVLKLYQHQKGNPFSLAENKVLSVSGTGDGLLWIGTANKGLSIYDQASAVFEVIKPEEDKSYMPLSCFLNTNDSLLVGHDDGVDVFLRKNNRYVYHSTFFRNNKVTALHQSAAGAVFIGTTRGLFLARHRSVKPVLFSQTQLLIADIKEDTRGHLLVSTHNGLYVIDALTLQLKKQFDRSAKTPEGKPYLKSGYLFCTLPAKNNAYYVNTTVGCSVFDTGFVFRNNVFDHFNYSSMSEIMITKSIEGATGSMWYSTLGNGIYRIKNGKTDYFNQSNGLSNNVVSAMEKDAAGNIWSGTNLGINCITPDGQIVAFNKELQLESAEFVTNGSYALGNRLFFCSNSGLLAFNADAVLKRKMARDYKLGTVLVLKNYTDTLLGAERECHLGSTDKILSFRFCVPGYRIYDKVQLFYRLEGFDEAWHGFENGQDVTFTNLPYGKYTLTVKASISGYGWEDQLQKTIIVHPPFWRKPWFIGLMVVFIVGVLVFGVWYASRIKLKKQLLQLQINQKVFEEKERISKDLHDNIGSQISTLISGLDKISLTQKADQAEKLSDYARHTLGELRETIWALNSQALDVNTLKQKLEDLVYEWRGVYEWVHIQFLFDVQENVPLHPQRTLSFYRIIQEAGNNALKHSEGDTLMLKVVQTETALEAVISDNGKGFDSNCRKKGHYGLDNMRVRAAQANLIYSMTSAPGSGTKIMVTLNYE